MITERCGFAAKPFAARKGDAFYARPADADERGGFAVKPFAACKGDAIEISCADGRTIRIDLEG